MEETFTFDGAQGHPLAARLSRPPGALRGTALFAHCFTCSKDLLAVRTIASALSTHGIATLSFDFTGLGQSEGEFADTTFSSNVADLVAAAGALRERLEAPQLLLGHSLGGAAVLAARQQIPEVTAVATVGAPADPAHVEKLFSEANADIQADGEAQVSIGGRPFKIRREFVEDLREHCSESTIAELDAALLVFHAPHDAIVGVDNARLIFEAARHPKSFVSLDGADHLLTRPADARYVANVLASWAERYMRVPNEGVPPGTVIVEGLQGLAQHVVAGHHPFNADEPENVGGGDTGPTPYDLLLAALGTCTSMTMRIVADREDIPLERARVTLSHHRVHAKDCVDCESKAGRVDVIERSITLFGDLDDAQRKRLEQIADRCPVHKTLRGEIQIKTEMKPSSG